MTLITKLNFWHLNIINSKAFKRTETHESKILFLFIIFNEICDVLKGRKWEWKQSLWNSPAYQATGWLFRYLFRLYSILYYVFVFISLCQVVKPNYFHKKRGVGLSLHVFFGWFWGCVGPFHWVQFFDDLGYYGFCNWENEENEAKFKV